MNLRTLLTINVFLSLFFGLTCLLAPKLWFSLFDAEVEPAGLIVSQLIGAAYLGFGVLAWQARSSRSNEFVLAVALALFVHDSIGAAVSIYAQISGVFNALGWSNVLTYLLLAVGYGYFRFLKKEVSQPA